MRDAKETENKGEPRKPGKENETKRVWEETKGVRKMSMNDLEMTLQLQHTGLLSVLEESLKEVPLDEEDGSLLGCVIKILQGERECLENGLKEIEGIRGCQLKHLDVPGMEKPPREVGLGGMEETPQDEVLQTVTVSLADVKRDLGSWVEPMKAEYRSLTQETQAVEAVHVNDLNPNNTEFVPGKMVCVIKAGPNGGKKKCRGVICGNMMESDPSPIGVYASGADGNLIRTVLRHASLRKWGISTTDIKTAFLLAPRVAVADQREVCVIPPTILVSAGICPATERWKVKRALYGLPSSPAFWALHRDQTMKEFSWDSTPNKRCTMTQSPEGNLWEIWESDGKTQSVVGHVLVYVDDMMVLGPPGIREGFLARLKSEWNCATPEEVSRDNWTRFSGFELQHGEDGSSIKISQTSYVKEMLSRHGITSGKTVPMPKWDTEEEPEENITKRDIKEAQGLTGELLWVSLRSRPDISFAVSQMGQQVTKRPRWAIQVGKHVLGFLFSTSDYCLHYRSEVKGHGFDDSLQIPRHERLIEAYSDISFAPGGNRSCQGVMVLFAGSPIQWEANRQAFCTLSTAESELMAAVEAMSMTQSVEALLSVIYRNPSFEKVLYCDNASTISILQNPDGSWRTRHLRLRANCLREKLRHDPERWKLRHMRGTLLVADLLTKPVTQSSLWKRFWRFLDFWSMSMTTWTESGGSEKTLKRHDGIDPNLLGFSSKGLGEKIAKIGCILGVFHQIPVGSFEGVWTDEIRNVLILVFTMLIAWLMWKLVGKTNPKQVGCRDLQRTSISDEIEKEKRFEKAKEQKESQEVRVDEPAQKGEKGSRKENEHRLQEKEGLREDEPKLSKCQKSRDSEEKTPNLPPSKGIVLGAVGGVLGRPLNWIRGSLGKGEVEKDGRRSFETLKVPVNRESFYYHCPTGCPKSPPVKVRAGAMVTEEGDVIKMAMLQGSIRGSSGQGELPWKSTEFLEPPRTKKDAWVQHWLDRGWLIRSHGSSRQRRFQPIHKSVPAVDPKTMTGRRVTVGWNDLHPHEAPHMVEDMWTDPPRNHYPYEKTWKGWTFLEMVIGKPKTSSYIGEGAGSSMDPRMKGGPSSEAEEGEGKQAPIREKGKQTTETFDPTHQEGYPWKRATKSDLSLPEVTVVTKMKFSGGKEHGRERTIHQSESRETGGGQSSGPLPREVFDEDSEWENVSEPADGF